MRIRTILAAAATPAALAAVLLGTAGQASAAVSNAAPAVLTASVQQAPQAGVASTREHGLADTTSVQTGTTDPAYGPVWAYDDVTRTVTWAPDAASPGSWNVTVATKGAYHAFANPATGTPWKGSGLMGGYVQYVVTPPAGVVPSAKNLPPVTDPSYRSGGILNELFGLPRDSSALIHISGGADGTSNWIYFGIPGQPDGLYFQHWRAHGPPRRPDEWGPGLRGYRAIRDLPELPPVRLHDLRLTHATTLLSGREPVSVVSERLGHASEVVTMTVYSHVLPGDQKRAAARFAELVSDAK